MGNGVSGEMQIFAEGELEAELKRLGGTGDASIKKILGKGYRDVVQLVIRPDRCRYELSELGPPNLRVAELSVSPTREGVTRACRRDFDVLNDRGLRVCCSHWQLTSENDHETPVEAPCLVYLHSNVGSRLDALRVRDTALRRGFSVLAFDCCGSGLSDGVYVTMGWSEAQDLHAVLQHLENDASVSEICLYAHSMGVFPAVVNVAVRAAGAADKKQRSKLANLPRVLQAGQGPQNAKPIRGLVLDSGYASMTQLNEGLLVAMQEEGFPVPKTITKVAVAAIHKSVKKRTEVDVDLLRPVDFVGLCWAPALFVTAKDDRYVAAAHSEELVSKYAGPATLMRVEGEHYDPRDASTYVEAVEFLYKATHASTSAQVP